METSFAGKAEATMSLPGHRDVSLLDQRDTPKVGDQRREGNAE
jgi:hypothetical protein